MARFLVLTTFTSQEGRLQHRIAHRAHLTRLADAGTLLMAGPFADESGGMIVFEADDEATVQSIMNADPFSVEGVFASVDIKPVMVVAGS